MSLKNFIKNLPAGGTFETLGNTGILFPYKSRTVPEKFFSFCSIGLEESREFNLATEEETQTLFMECP